MEHNKDATILPQILCTTTNTTLDLEPFFPCQTEHHSIYSDFTQDTVFDGYFMGRLMEMETDLMDLSSDKNQEYTMMGLHQSFDFAIDKFIDQEMVQETVHVLQEEVLELEGSSLTDLLLMGAEAIEQQNWGLSATIIAKLKNLLEFDRDNSINKLVLFFTQGLHYKCINSYETLLDSSSSVFCSQSEHNISAFYQVVHEELSPYVKFAHFTANQAILEATQGDSEIHVVDFDIMEGIQWPPLMVDLSMRNNCSSLKLTAIISDQKRRAMVQNTGRRLKEYADSIDFPFLFDQMVMTNEEDFKNIEMGHSPVVNCMIHQLHMPKRSLSDVKTFLDGMMRFSPKMIVLVEEELFNFAKISTMSYVEFFCEAFHHYSAISDSLLCSFRFCKWSKTEEVKEVIEREFLGVRILGSVSQFPCEKRERVLWGEGFDSLKISYKTIPLSSNNVSQANSLVTLFNGGYWVRHEKCRLALCWKSRPLTTASVWVPRTKQQVMQVNHI